MATRVLVVDDEAHIRRVMRMTLETAGYEVGEASDGPTALEQFGDGTNWAAVLLDQRMPGMDGLETLRRMNADVRIIMVTAYGSIELAVDAMKLGATDFVRKPMTPEILRNAVLAAMTQRKAAPSPAAQVPAHPHPLVSRVTMNGFRFWPALEEGRPAPQERLFVVEYPDGHVEPVRVEILPEVISTVESHARRRLPVGGEFWTVQAEKALGGYLWAEGQAPANGRLTISTIDQATLDLAGRWDAPV